MLKYIVVAAMLTAFATPAMAAEYYVVQDPSTKKCKIAKTMPDGQSMIMVGTAPYATKDEAKAARTAAAECEKKS